MSTTPRFGTRTLGETEKALNAILDRQLAGTGLTEIQWIALSLARAAGAPIERGAFVERLVGGVKVSPADAEERINELIAAGRLEETDGSLVTMTAAGRELHGQILATIAQITERLWGDLPSEDLAVTARVLDTILARANVELAAA